MYIMNVDDAGSFNTKDKSRYYILSGVIVKNSDYKDVKQKIFQYKLDHFKDDYIDAEVHVHEMYKSKPPFTSLLLKEKYLLLDNLYSTINALPVTLCPTKCYSEENGKVLIQHEGCVDCGTCSEETEWKHPRGEKGIHYQYG